MKYSDLQRVRKIRENAARLLDYIAQNDIRREDLLRELHLQWLVTTPLYNIGEHVYHLSQSFKDEHSQIPWPMIAGVRHRLVHDYDGTNWNIMADIVFEELPAFVKQLDEIIDRKP